MNAPSNVVRRSKSVEPSRVGASSGWSDPVIQVTGLSRRFGDKRALDAVNLSVARGTVHGLVGANGAGKTTLIKHILGLLRTQQGSVRVFGRNPVSDPVGVLSRLGYLSEDADLPDWMRVGELLRYSRAFHDAWDDNYATELQSLFGLDESTQIRRLSKGQRARAGLLVALAYRPELLLLDEPSSGLDPIVRRDILAAILRTIADEGRTVLFSSHLLEEVEQVADHITMINHGRIVLSESLASIRDSHHGFGVRFPEPQQHPPTVPGVLRWEGGGQHWTALVRGETDELEAAVAGRQGRLEERRSPSLDEIFVAHVGESEPSTGRPAAPRAE